MVKRFYKPLLPHTTNDNEKVNITIRKAHEIPIKSINFIFEKILNSTSWLKKNKYNLTKPERGGFEPPVCIKHTTD